MNKKNRFSTAAAAAILGLSFASLAAAAPYTTTFPATENPISQGGMWTNGLATGLDWNNVQTVPGEAYAAHVLDVARYADDIAILNTSFTADQYAQGTVYRVPGYKNPTDGHEIELLLRFKITAHSARGYEVMWGQEGYICIARWNGPLSDYTQLGGCTANSTANQAVAGDVLRAEIKGNVIKVYRNGSLVLTGPANTTYTDGQPGMGFWPTPGSTLASYGWKKYEAGSLTGTGAERAAAEPAMQLALRSNPVRTNACFDISAPAAFTGIAARLDIYNVRGRRVFRASPKLAGAYTNVVWNGRDENGRPAASGIYVAYLTVGKERLRKCFSLL